MIILHHHRNPLGLRKYTESQRICMRWLFLVINLTGFRMTNGGRFLRTSARVCPESFHGGGKAHPDCESDIVVKSKPAEDRCSSLPTSCLWVRCDSCLCPCCHGFSATIHHILKPSPINPSFLTWLSSGILSQQRGSKELRSNPSLLAILPMGWHHWPGTVAEAPV